MTTLLLVAAITAFVVGAMRFLLKDAYRQAAAVIDDARRDTGEAEWEATASEVSALTHDIGAEPDRAPFLGWTEIDDLQLERLLRQNKP
ncbi:hypothetical protein SAMN05892883_4027 [Jatrophihabitans sp. GAS493]|uniref:hypothetical protein n=1 Tax=Jatrophihabitans sp. GAS493 TaxID=1907575 RepID=UPI000BB82A30|nr:hypothetical protein [Jatrophihabitans sp. GAS493]SOD74834.1 hypothetical protein SAMN05892883_4027 [Jatrophihabitans sp. GAS493]